MKRSSLYTSIILSWWCLLLVFTFDLVKPIIDAYFLMSTSLLLIISCASFVMLYAWLYSLKEVVFALFYYVHKGLPRPRPSYSGKPTVALIYSVKNDFSAEACQHSLAQSYKHVSKVILDESTLPNEKKKVSYFAKRHQIPVIRRPQNIARNLPLINYYLLSNTADYFIVLTSKEIIASTFIEEALRYAKQAKVAVVQGEHQTPRLAKTARRFYQRESLQLSHAYLLLKSSYGFLPYTGAGALVNKKAYNTVSLFPRLLEFDPLFAIALRNNGYTIRFAPELTCQKEHTITGFRKNNKLPTMKSELLRSVLFSKMYWYEKVDALLSIYPPSVLHLVGAYVVMNLIVLPLYYFKTKYSLSMLLPTLFFIVSPYLQHFIYTAKEFGLSLTIRKMLAPLWSQLRQGYRLLIDGTMTLTRILETPLSAKRAFKVR